MVEYIVLDFETANPRRVSACSLGGCVICDGQIVDRFSTFIKPPPEAANFSVINTKIHGITPEMVAEAPTFGDLFPKFYKRVAGRIVLAYSKFDRSVIDNLLEYYGEDCQYQYVDVCEMAKENLSGLKNYKLPTVAKHLGIEKFRHHCAEEDAVACAKVFLALNADNQSMLSKVKDLPPTEMTQEKMQEIFDAFVDNIIEDGVIDYKEATELFYFLASLPQTKVISAIRESLFDILDDEVVEDYESEKLIEQLLYAKAHLFD